MKLATRAVLDIPKPAEAVFGLATDASRFPETLRRYGPIPGVVGVEPLGANTRRVTMTDGSTLDEEVVEVEPPRRNRYRWLTLPKPPFSWLVRGAEATWTFDPQDGGTRVTWRYELELRSPLLIGPSVMVLALFRRWMLQGLRAVRDLA